MIFENISITSESSISVHKKLVKRFKSTVPANRCRLESRIKRIPQIEGYIRNKCLENDNTDASSRHYGFRIRSNSGQSHVDSQFSSRFYIKQLSKIQVSERCCQQVRWTTAQSAMAKLSWQIALFLKFS